MQPSVISLPSFSSTSPYTPLDIVVLCEETQTPGYRAPLQSLGRVLTTPSSAAAVEALTRTRSPLLIVDGDHQEHPVDVCAQARRLQPLIPSILVTVSRPEAAGNIIDVCESILLKPFAPNLLASRVGRLLRLHSRELRERSQRVQADVHRSLLKSEHLMERSRAGTLIEWPTEYCPSCGHGGIVMFDYASLRRAWYACASCRKVWMAKRLEQGPQL